jgi:hypothetical protein
VYVYITPCFCETNPFSGSVPKGFGNAQTYAHERRALPSIRQTAERRGTRAVSSEPPWAVDYLAGRAPLPRAGPCRIVDAFFWRSPSSGISWIGLSCLIALRRLPFVFTYVPSDR